MEAKSFEREVIEKLAVLETLLKQQDYKGLCEKVDQDHEKIIKDEEITKSHERRILKLEDNNKWLWRTVAGALILGAMAILFGV